MKAFEIKTEKSDYPFLVIADSITEAIKTICVAKNMAETDITNIECMGWQSNHIVVQNY